MIYHRSKTLVHLKRSQVALAAVLYDRKLSSGRTTRRVVALFGFDWGVLFLFWLMTMCCAPLMGQVVNNPPEGSPILFGTNADVNNSVGTGGPQLGLVQDDNELPKSQKRGEFAVAPIPMVNPSIGNGGGLVVMYATRLGGAADTSPPSTLGLAGFATALGSWGLGGGGKLNLKNDKFRISVGAGGGTFDYNYFGTGTVGGNAGISIPLAQSSKGFLLEPKVRVFGKWYVGPRYHIISSVVSLNSSTLNPVDLPIALPTGDLNLKTAAFGGRVLRDTSDSSFYPRRGAILDVLGDLYGPAVGGKRTYQNLTIGYSYYHSLGTKNVFAIRGSACMVTSAAPFYDLCLLGMSKDLRGYQVGQFRDNRMVVGQAEYRRDLFWRVGAVAFAGAGAVAPTWAGFGSAEPKPGGGVGLRFVLAKRNHINLRADFAWGENSRATYISVGEAF